MEQYETWKALLRSGTALPFWQEFYVKFYQAFLENNRWLQYLEGVGTTLLVTALALRDSFVPPTIHYQVPDEACDLDIVPNVGRSAELKYAMSNSLGFGGHNVSLLFKRWEG